MKSTKQLFAIVFVFLMTATAAFAQNTKTFYVCSGTNFTLTPAGTFANYEWDEVNGINPLAVTHDLALTSPTIANAIYVMKRYTLKVKDAGTGCWSDADTFTVYTLPPIGVTVTGADTAYCANASGTATLQAAVAALTLPAGVSANQYAWTLNGTATGTNSAQLPVTIPNVAGTTNYAVTVTYSLPTPIGGSKINTCVGVGTISISVAAPPATPTVTIF